MSETEDEQPLELTEIDPIEQMVRDWIRDNILPEVQAHPDWEEGMQAGISISLDDLGFTILDCFDSIQALMMSSIRGENETLH